MKHCHQLKIKMKTIQKQRTLTSRLIQQDLTYRQNRCKSIKIEDEVIVPKFQGVIAGEVNGRNASGIVDAAKEVFGEDGT